MTNRPPNKNQWLTLAQAARQLAVHPTTLRRWSNNGDIPVMLTPGGHRRFNPADLEQFSNERHAIRPAGGIERVWANAALERTRQRMTDRRSPDWMNRFDETARRHHRVLGHKLMELMLRYLSEKKEDDAVLEEAAGIGREYGDSAIGLNLSLKQALEASMFFRDALVGSTMELPDKVKIRPEERMRLLGRINKLLNLVQLTVAEVYDAHDSNRLSRS